MNDAVNVEVDNSQVAAQTPVNNGNVATNVETDNSQLSTQAVDNSVDNSQVINTATPMDTNRTYDNLSQEERTPAIGDHVSPLQGAIEDAMAIQRNRLMNQNAGAAMDNFLNNEYDYDRNEAGTYWVAGAINDNATQMKFLDAIVKEQMYDDLDLQKYYYDNTMATARAYAAAKNKEAAYKFYRAAQEKAITEASFTGWYMPAEGEYMLGQYTVAQTTLARDDATPEEINKAKDVIKTTEKWFNANQIGTRGIKCLSLLNFEERVRHNKEAERLQDQANKIAAASAGVADELAKLQLRQFKFRVEELELQTGRNFSKEIGLDNADYLGHDITDPEYAKYSMLFGGETLEEIARDTRIFEDIKTARGIQWLKSNLGDKYQEIYDNYNAAKDSALIEDLDYNTEYIDKNNLHKIGGELSVQNIGGNELKEKSVYALYNYDGNGNLETRLYIEDKDGRILQLNEREISDLTFKNGNTINDYIAPNTFTSDKVYNKSGFEVRVGQNVQDDLAFLKDHYSDEIYKEAKKMADKGYKLDYSKMIKNPETGTWDTGYVGLIFYKDTKDADGNITRDIKGMYTIETAKSILGHIQGTNHDVGDVVDLDESDLKDIADQDYSSLKSWERGNFINKMDELKITKKATKNDDMQESIRGYYDTKTNTTKFYKVTVGADEYSQIPKTSSRSNPADISVRGVDVEFRPGSEEKWEVSSIEEISQQEAESIVGKEKINNYIKNNDLTMSKYDSTKDFSVKGRDSVDTTDLDLGNVSQADARKIISEGSNISSEERKALYEKYNVSESEAPKFDALHGESLVEALKDKSMNDVLESQIGG